jgi:hypothetical protein
MRTPALFALALTCLLGVTTPGHAAGQEKPEGVPPLRPMRRETGDFKTLVLVDCKIEDRPRLDSFIDRTYPDAKVLYTDINEHVGGDAIHELSYGVGSSIRTFHHSELVLISGFTKATTKIEGKSDQDSSEYWKSIFTSTPKHKAIKLHLCTTDKEVPDAYLRFVDKSAGSYRKLTLDKDGNYQ